MTDTADYHVVLFRSVTEAIKAERILQEAGITVKTIPVPRHISSDCGVCLRFDGAQRDGVAAALAGRVDNARITPL